MTVVERTALVPYSAEQLFDIVNDVRCYPAFLPWCESAQVIEETHETLTATLTLARAGIRQSFTTKNFNEPPGRIHLTLVEGPFSKLDGVWTFTQLGNDGARVHMRLEFEVSNRLLRTTLSAAMGKIADTLVDAFCDRARVLHG